MDPLSTAASVIAIVQIAQKCIKGISTLRALQQAPEQLSALLNEISDLQAVLSQIELVAQQPVNQNNAGPILALNSQIRRATDKLNELDNLVQGHLIKHSKDGNIKAARRAWFRERDRVAALQGELRVTRMNICTALGAVQTSTLNRVDLEIQRISTQISAQQEASSNNLTILLAALSSQSPTNQPKLFPNSSLNRLAAHNDGFPHNQLSTSSGTSGQHSLVAFTVRPRGFRDICKTWCSCACHSQGKLRTPQRLRGVLGSLFVGYSGMPGLTPACDDRTCRRRASLAMDLVYYFPVWFLSRAFALNFSLTTFGGPELMVRMPRMVSWGTPLWRLARDGDLPNVQILFSKGVASPYDVNAYGQSALHYAIRNARIELTRYLIEQGADINLADENGRYFGQFLLAYDHTRKPIETAWDVVLSKSLPSSEADRLASLFNDSSFLESRRFSPIHKIVLGLSQHPLEPELTQASPAQVNLVDAQGRTALAWAAARHDTEAVKLLLDAGADPRALDFEGCSPLFNAVRAMDCEAAKLLLSYGADVHQRDVYGATALHVACEKNDCPEMVEVLAAAGLNVNSIDLDGDPPLHYAIWEDRADTVRTLLDLGADPSIANVAGDNAVFMALYHGASRSFGILLERGAPVDMTTTSGQTILHVAAMLPKFDILSRLATVDLGKIDPDLIDVNGKRYEDYFRESIDISDERMLAAARSFMNVVNQAKAAKGVEGPFPIPLATGSRNQVVGVKETQSDESEDEQDFVDALETLSI